jgi:hypothetical protein
MTIKSLASVLMITGGLSVNAFGADDSMTPPVSPDELEARYTMVIEKRASDILDSLDLQDAAKARLVHSAIVDQYRALRARDAVIACYLRAQGESDTEASPERAALSGRMTEPLHEMYIKTLSAYLTPDQVEMVKDSMTYNKVQVTFDAYCEIFPALTDSQKAMITQQLKAAREVAINGGSANEKHAMFDLYKERINAELKAAGHDVEKAFSDWEAKQSHASASGDSAGNSTN